MLTAALRARDRICGIGSDDGFSLVELVVTMTLMSIVGAMALTWFIGTSNSDTTTTESGLTAAGARNAVQSWSSLLQVATPPDPSTPTVRSLSLSATSIAFSADLGNLPSCAAVCSTNAPSSVVLGLRPIVVNSKTTNQLFESVTIGMKTTTSVEVPSGAAATGPNSCLFTPYTASGTAMACTGLSPAQLATVARVDINFSVTPIQGSMQSFTTSVSVPGSVS